MPVNDKVVADFSTFAVIPDQKNLVGFDQSEEPAPRIQGVQNAVVIVGLITGGNAKRLV